ncbi:hypothetical protein ACQEU3_47080 [Spirillospora sp. CA-253888]
MTPTDAAELLLHCAAFDNRKPSAAAAKAWAAALHDVPLDEDTLNAVARYYGTPEPGETGNKWMQPHHVRTHRKAIRGARLDAAGTLAQHNALHGAEPATEADHRRALREIQRRIGDEDQPPPFRAIDAPRPGTQVPAGYAQLRADWETERAQLREAEAAERARRMEAADAERAERRRVTDAYGLLLTLTPDAQAHAYARATADLGEHTDRDTLTVRAAELADHTQTAALPADLAETLSPAAAAATARRLARTGCPSGCEIGTHEPACTHYAAYTAVEEDR